MSRRIKGLLLAACCLTLAYFGNVWLQSYLGRKALQDTGLAVLSLNRALEIATDDRPVLLAVSAIWCPNCRRFDHGVLDRDVVRSEIENHWVYARLEYESDAGQQFLKRAGVSGFPNLFVVNREGAIERHLDLTFEPETFVRQLIDHRTKRAASESADPRLIQETGL